MGETLREERVEGVGLREHERGGDFHEHGARGDGEAAEDASAERREAEVDGTHGNQIAADEAAEATDPRSKGWEIEGELGEFVGKMLDEGVE